MFLGTNYHPAHKITISNCRCQVQLRAMKWKDSRLLWSLIANAVKVCNSDNVRLILFQFDSESSSTRSLFEIEILFSSLFYHINGAFSRITLTAKFLKSSADIQSSSLASKFDRTAAPRQAIFSGSASFGVRIMS